MKIIVNAESIAHTMATGIDVPAPSINPTTMHATSGNAIGDRCRNRIASHAEAFVHSFNLTRVGIALPSCCHKTRLLPTYQHLSFLAIAYTLVTKD
jgi:hypothetical protein